MREGLKRALPSQELASLNIDVSPEGMVLILLSTGDDSPPAVMGFGSEEARRMAMTLMQAAREAEAIESKRKDA
jgi:hypothetical protein